jgi:hypothetical protein
MMTRSRATSVSLRMAGGLAVAAGLLTVTAALSLPTVGASRTGAAVAVVGFRIGVGAASLVKPTIWPTGRPQTPEESH